MFGIHLESDFILLLLSRFSRVRLCATPKTAAHQAPRSLGFSRQEHWSGVGCHFLLQCMKVKSDSEFAQSCLTLSDPMDCSLPGCSVHGIFQARVLEWGAIAFSETTTRSIQLVAIHFRNYSLLNLSSHLSLACAQVSEYSMYFGILLFLF